jgi:hypothetical protein
MPLLLPVRHSDDWRNEIGRSLPLIPVFSLFSEDSLSFIGFLFLAEPESTVGDMLFVTFWSAPWQLLTIEC